MDRDKWKSALADVNDGEVREFDAPGWPGGKGYVCSMTQHAFDFIYPKYFLDEETTSAQAKASQTDVLLRSLCTEDGSLIFGEGDAAELGRLSASILQRAWSLALKLASIVSDDKPEVFVTICEACAFAVAGAGTCSKCGQRFVREEDVPTEAAKAEEGN